MSRHRRRTAIGAALASGLLLFLGTSPAHAEDLSDQGAQSFADIAACAGLPRTCSRRSLWTPRGASAETDPDDERVQAIVTAVDALEQLGASSGGKLEVEANLATFGADYSPLVGWGAVEGAHADDLRSAAQNELPSLDKERFTDYRAAMRGAQQQLDSRAAELDGPSCKVMLWFTDGQLDVDGTGKGAVTEAARAELCTPQGIVDGVRGDHVAVVALALFTEGQSGSVTEQDRQRLQAIAEGQGAGERCGTVPIPASSAPGAYLSANDAGALRRMFANAAALIEGGTQGGSVTCPDATCVDGRYSIPLDQGVERFRLVIEAQPGAPASALEAPDGETVALDGSTTKVGSATVSSSSRDGLTTVEVRDPRADGRAWTLVANPASPSAVDVYYFWGITLEVKAPDGIVIGESSKVEVVPRHSDGSVVDLSQLSSADLSVTVNGSSVPATQSTDGWTASVTMPAGDAAGVVGVQALARGVSSPSAIKLGPVTTEQSFDTSFPPSFPAVEPRQIVLSRMVGDAAGTAAITVTGAERGPTKVCATNSAITGPQPAGTISVVTDPSCVTVPANATSTMSVSVTATHPADGHVTGSVTLTLTGVDGQTLKLALPVTGSMIRPVDQGARAGYVAGFVLLAILLAWLTAVVARRLADRFVLGVDARSASIPVIVDARGIRRADGEDWAMLDPAEDFRHLGVTKRRRMSEFSAEGVRFARRFPLVPVRDGQPYARADDGSVVMTEQRGQAPADGSTAPTTFPGSTGYVLVAQGTTPDDSGAIRGRLVLVVDSPRGVAAVLADRLDIVLHGTSWDVTLDRIHAAWRSREQAAVGREARGRRGPARGESSAPAAEPASDSTPDQPPPPPLFDVDADTPPPPPSGTWESSAPSPTDDGRRSRRDRPRAEPEPSPDPEPKAPTTPADDAPPPTTNFWD